MRHQCNQRNLAHISGFTGHVGAGDDHHASILRKFRVVGHKELLAGCLYNGVATFANGQIKSFVNLRTAIATLSCNGCQGLQGVQFLDSPRGCLKPADLLGQLVAYGCKELIFQTDRFILRAQDRLLYFLQILRDEAFTVGQRLLALIAIRYERKLRARDLDIISKDLVVSDLQVLDAGFLALMLLDLRNPLAAAGGSGAQFIQFFAVTGFDDVALPDRQRRILGNSAFQQSANLVHRIEPIQNVSKRAALITRQEITQLRNHAKRITQCKRVARIDAAVRNLGHQPLNIIDRLERLAHLLREHIVVHQLIDSIQAIFDFLLFGQGLFDPAAQQAATHGGCRAVEQPEQRSLLSSAAHGLGQLKIPPRNGIKQQMLAAIVDVNRVDMRQRVLLRFFQILQQCTGSGDSQIQFSQAQCCDGNAGMLFD